jgi:hypothetical protein
MKLFFKITVMVSMLLISTQIQAQNSDVSRATLVGVPGVTVYVDSLAQHLVVRGMTEDVFRVEVERRLMESGIKLLNPAIDGAVPGNPVLYVDITSVFDEAIQQVHYSIRVELTQTARLERNPGFAVFNVPTWSVGGIGFYGTGWRDAMINDVLGFTEQFIGAFFEANHLLRPEAGDSTKTEGVKYNAPD